MSVLGATTRRVSFALAVVVVWSHGVHAQPPKISRVGYLNAESAAGSAHRLEALRSGLHELGYVEGKNLVIEPRWGDGNYERLPDMAAELVRLKVNVIVTSGTKATLGARRATTTIPIVMGSSGDVVAVGLAGSLAQPGGNITGSTNVGRELGPKRLELLREVIPRMTRVAYLANPENPALGPNLQAMWQAARASRVELQPFEARKAEDIARAFAGMVQAGAHALVVQDETLFGAHAGQVASLAARNRLPAAGGKTLAEAGALLGYGPNIAELDRRAALFVDKILRGAKPADLPIEQPTKFDLLVNLKTARTLGLTFPPTLLQRAERVIQ